MSAIPNANPAADDQVCLWHCPQCCESGAVLTDPHVDVYTVVKALEDAHHAKAPNCPALVGKVRITRPNDWLKSMTDPRSATALCWCSPKSMSPRRSSG